VGESISVGGGMRLKLYHGVRQTNPREGFPMPTQYFEDTT
jgi:hypothetical protein